MAFDRASAADYDAWESLGNKGWGWKGLLPYFRKSTTFTPPPESQAKEYGITYDASYYGKNGPIHAAYPPFEYLDTKSFWNAYRALGVPTPKEHASGDAVGALWVLNSLNPNAQTRSHAGNACFDPVSSRPNLKLLTGQKVTKIPFSGPKATGVSLYLAPTRAPPKRNLYPPPPTSLGIGPKSILQAAGIQVKKNLQSVGANFQDHPGVFMMYDLATLSFPNPNTLSENATYNSSAWHEYTTKRTEPYTYAHGNSLSFISLPTITKNSKSIVAQLKRQKPSDYLPPIYSDRALLKGYKAQKSIIADLLASKDAAAGEIPMTPSGFIIAALQRPASRGTITLDPKDVHGNPIVEYNTMQNPVNRAILAEMVRWARQLWASKQLAGLSPTEILPGPAAQSDEEIMGTLIGSGMAMPSFSHPSSACSMMPEHMGGCVGDDLLVYGVKGLSVVDASIIPLIPATHIQATVYAIAEKAADIIKARG